MLKSFRCLWRIHVLPTFAVIWGIMLALTVIANGGVARMKVFRIVGQSVGTTYFGMYSIMMLMVLLIVSSSLGTAYFQLALSHGARRKDYCLALHAVFAVYALGLLLMRTVMCALPDILDWPFEIMWEGMLTIGNMSAWCYALIAFTAAVLGCAIGMLATHSKALGTVIYIVLILAMLAAVVFVMVMFNHYDRYFGSRYSLQIAAVCVLLIIGAEWYLLRTVRTVTVK